MVGVHGAIHEHSIDKLKKLHATKITTKNLMKSIHQNTIKYLTYVILNKLKSTMNKTPMTTPP